MLKSNKNCHIIYYFKKYLDFNSNIIFEGQLYNQIYNTVIKDIEGIKYTLEIFFEYFQYLEQE